jgi:hypothetical protein
MKRPILTFSLVIITLIVAACGNQIDQSPSVDMGKPVLPDLPDCSQAELVSETIPNGSKYQAGQKFDKTWVIRNVSPCNWDSEYSLVYYDGIGMGESTHLLFTANLPEDAVIPPGDIITLTLNLRAPFSAGRQVGHWKLRDSNGILFVPQNVAQNALIVDIEVTGTVVSFVDILCQAHWTLNGQEVSCPSPSDSNGYQLLINSFPVFEGHNDENEASIEITLPDEKGSILVGTFPPIEIHNGDHLHLGTGCGDDTPQCDLTFEVAARTETGQTILGQWHEISDGNMQSMDLDLSHLANQSVQFIFTLHSNGAIQGNRGFWFFPIVLPY